MYIAVKGLTEGDVVGQSMWWRDFVSERAWENIRIPFFTVH
jgi:hypothetical protein